jgi:hypothetical protein
MIIPLACWHTGKSKLVAMFNSSDKQTRKVLMTHYILLTDLHVMGTPILR